MSKKAEHEMWVKKRLDLGKHILILNGAVWVACLALFLNSISGFAGVNLITGNVVAEGVASEAAKPSIPSIVSAVVYFLGLIVLGGGMFVVSKHTQELRSMLKIEKQERKLIGSPRQALVDFFSILSTWSMKNMEQGTVLKSLESIREDEKKDFPSLRKVSFRLSKEDDLIVEANEEPDWEELRGIFKAYLNKLEIDPEKMLHIADYLGRNDLGTMLCKLQGGKLKDDGAKECLKEEKREKGKKSSSRARVVKQKSMEKLAPKKAKAKKRK